jgi:hypothetical protein
MPDPVFGGVLRRAWTCAQRAPSISHPSAIDTPSRATSTAKATSLVALLYMLSVHAYPGDHLYAGLARTAPVPPHHPARRRRPLRLL